MGRASVRGERRGGGPGGTGHSRPRPRFRTRAACRPSHTCRPIAGGDASCASGLTHVGTISTDCFSRDHAGVRSGDGWGRTVPLPAPHARANRVAGTFAALGRHEGSPPTASPRQYARRAAPASPSRRTGAQAQQSHSVAPESARPSSHGFTTVLDAAQAGGFTAAAIIPLVIHDLFASGLDATWGTADIPKASGRSSAGIPHSCPCGRRKP